MTGTVSTSRRAALRAGPDVEATVVVGVVDGHRVVHGVLDVLVGDAVLASRRMDVEHES